MNVLLNGRGGKVGSVLGPGLEAAGHTLVDTLAGAEAMVDFTRPDAVVANVRAAVDAGVPSVVGTTGWDVERVSRRAGDGLLRAELRARGGADDALRGRGGAAFRARRDRRAAPCGEARRAVRHREADGGAHGRQRADPLGAPAGPERAPGSASSAERARRFRSVTTRSRARRTHPAYCSRSRSCRRCHRG